MPANSAPDYTIRPQGSPPPGYPDGPKPDTFTARPGSSTYLQRRQEFIQHCLHNPAPHNTKAVWHELVRLAGGGKIHQGVIQAAIDFVSARRDCTDFVLHGLLRLLYQFTPPAEANPGLSGALITRAEEAVLGFKYFPNEPGLDSLCTWTENHYILFTSGAYLAGQRYPERTFTNSGHTGRQKMDLNRPRILRWLDLRFRTGFSEWLSHVYYDEDLVALLNLVDFCQDPAIVCKAEMVIDLLLFDQALNSFQGVFGSTHGRSYEHTKKWAAAEGTTDTGKLLFGRGVFSGFDNMSAAALALSRYEMPPVIATAQQPLTFTNRQRMGIRLAEMERWGLRPDNFEDGMHCLTLEAYLHPRTIANTMRMFDTCNWWENSFFSPFKPYRRFLRILRSLGALGLLGRALERDTCRNTREEVNIYTYRTPDYMLSTAQDYRPGFGGDQQHIWQATLGPEAVCFTTHPAGRDGPSPTNWTGSGLLPRAAQVKNVAIVIYNIKKIPALYVPVRCFYTQAWLPQDRFDEVGEQNGWIFARLADGYLALRSMQPYAWQVDPSPTHENRSAAGGVARQVVAQGSRNIWICQLGRRSDDGSFDRFVEQVSTAELAFDGLQVAYHSPGNGCVRFGWKGPLSVDGVDIPIHNYPRYDNPFSQTPFDPQVVHISAAGHQLVLDWKECERRLLASPNPSSQLEQA